MIAGFSRSARAPQHLSAYRTEAPTPAPALAASEAGALPTHLLRADEVSRHAVRLLLVDPAHPGPQLHPFSALPHLLRRGDLLVVNDAATLPASLRGTTASGAPLELRLSGAPDHALLHGVLLGAGDHTTRTEDRPAPPPLAAGERLTFHSATGAAHLSAVVMARRGRLVTLRAETDAASADLDEGDALWAALYRVGAPVQYAHRPAPLALWSVQTAYASRPWAAEMPSAGRPLLWSTLLALRHAGVAVASLTHAAGLSATGEPALDAALPWPERYQLPDATARAIAQTRGRGGRVIAAGTTVVRALEASRGLAGSGLATLRLDATTSLRVVDGVISGLHVPGESHFELLTAFAPRPQLIAAIAQAAHHGLSGHELGDACLVLRAPSI